MLVALLEATVAVKVQGRPMEPTLWKVLGGLAPAPGGWEDHLRVFSVDLGCQIVCKLVGLKMKGFGGGIAIFLLILLTAGWFALK